MKKRYSQFKKKDQDKQTFRRWVTTLETANGYDYEKWTIETSLGTTQIYGLNTEDTTLETLVIFPGFRTSALIWDLDQGLAPLAKKMRLFLVETNGQPNLSEGHSPSIRSLDYGKWGAEVLEQLGLASTYIAGASFGGLVCMKIALVVSSKIKGAFLLNPGCFRMVSFGLRNLYHIIVPILKPSDQNIRAFLDYMIFHKPNHQLSKDAESKLVAYLQLAISQYKDRTQKPYYMGKQLNGVSVPTYLLIGNNDPLIPPKKSIENAKKHLGEHLKAVVEWEGVGHGIECYPPAMAYIANTIQG